ncbi:MAG: adenylosuccinate synthase [Candidatus Delongbacteria bacterium]|nr:adenylosuccinate synthase [Candidatus Delongbacteria bacterium]MCG2761229.1 adenylosuccinate synthase [Candidatus Delongbacteria bacterium]
MSVRIAVGAQWGDEGKGKIIDLLSSRSYLVVRYQGGANAGHTVKINEKKFILHMIPSGVLHENTVSAIGNGVVFDYESFISELDTLKMEGINPEGRLFLSPYAHVVMPYHKEIDRALENSRKNKIGTTFKGIGPAYQDKISRCGIRVADILDKDYFPIILKNNIDLKNQMFEALYREKDKFDFNKIYNECLEKFEFIKKYVKDVSIMIDEAYNQNKSILFEGAQGTLLDIDHGTYPFVTSSNTTSGGVCTGTGISPTRIDSVLGVMKAYTTRVGNGPFVTELFDEVGKYLSDKGHEIGATTGRPRRCGYYDALIARYSVRVNGISSLALTKIDVLGGLDKIKVCVGYKYKNEILKEFVPVSNVLEKCEPVYEELDGWKEDISEIKNYNDLPLNTRKYIDYIEKVSNVPVEIVSVGPERNQSIFK